MINALLQAAKTALEEFQAALLDGAGKIGYEAETSGFSDFPTE